MAERTCKTRSGRPAPASDHMRILFLAHLLPLPVDSGGKIKSYHTLRALARAHSVMLLAYVRNKEEEALVPELEAFCDGVETVPLSRGRVKQLGDLAGSLLRGTSFIVTRDYRKEMKEALKRAVSEFRPDVVHIDHLQMVQFVEPGGAYKTVLDQHNVEHVIIRRLAETSNSAAVRLYARLEWPKLRRYEIEHCRRSDLVLAVSEEDRSAFQKLDPKLGHIDVAPIGVDTDYFQPVERVPESRNILSIGTMYWPPNVESMLYFAGEILPLVRRSLPDCTLTIAGQRPVGSIRALARDPGIAVTGYVEDARQIAKDCGVFVVPLRSGSGVRVKILNALAMGLPVVSTSVGAEGLEVIPGEHLLVADSPSEFADAVVRVLRDPELAERLGRRGRELVCGLYSWESVGERLLGVYERRFGGAARR